MNLLLADWYHDVSIDADAGTIAARGAALDELAPTLTPSQTMALVAVAHEQEPTADDEWFRAAFKRHDASFRMRDNGREVALLAAVCLVDACAGDGDEAVLAASAAAVAARRGWSSAVRDLPVVANQRLVDLGTSRRQLAPAPVASKHVAWVEGAQAATAETIMAAIGQLGASVNTALDAAASQLGAVSAWAERSLDLLAEESDLMAWLLAGQCTTLGRPWAETDPATAAVLAGREIAGLLAVSPAPPQADALIDQVLASTRFAKRPSETELPPIDVPTGLAALVQDDPRGGREPADLGRLSVRQAVLLDVWARLE